MTDARAAALEAIACTRCRGFVEAETTGAPILADAGRLTFAGGSPEALVAHFGPLVGTPTNRTCPTSLHQIEWRPPFQRQPAWSRIELVPGSLGPKPTDCSTCREVRSAILAGERTLQSGGPTLVPATLWPFIATKYRSPPGAERARCPECGRPAYAGPYGSSASVSEHPDPEAATGRLPRLDCARCDTFVRRFSFYAGLRFGGLAIEGVSESLHGALLPDRLPGAPPGPLQMGEDLRCADCSRKVSVVEIQRSAGYLVFALSR